MAREAISGALTVREAIEAYLVFSRSAGIRDRSLVTAGHQMRRFFEPVLDQPIATVTPRKAAALYERVRTVPGVSGKVLAVATQRTCLLMAKVLFNWCVNSKLVRSNPIASVKGVGVRNRGKAQLRLDEARRLVRLCLERFAAGDQAALAVLLALVMGMRAGEIVTRSVRDLDDGGRLLWIDDTADGWRTKTRAGRRALAVPPVLQPLLRQIALDKQATDKLFLAPLRDGPCRPCWVRENTQRLCRDAGLPRVCAHSLRGLHATIAIQAGASPGIVANALGHEAPSMTLSAYAAPGSLEAGLLQSAATKLLTDPRPMN